MFKDKEVIDFGCGAGGKSMYYVSLGAKHVTGVDIVEQYEKDSQDYGTCHDVHLRPGKLRGRARPLYHAGKRRRERRKFRNQHGYSGFHARHRQLDSSGQERPCRSVVEQRLIRMGGQRIQEQQEQSL